MCDSESINNSSTSLTATIIPSSNGTGIKTADGISPIKSCSAQATAASSTSSSLSLPHSPSKHNSLIFDTNLQNQQQQIIQSLNNYVMPNVSMKTQTNSNSGSSSNISMTGIAIAAATASTAVGHHQIIGSPFIMNPIQHTLSTQDLYNMNMNAIPGPELGLNGSGGGSGNGSIGSGSNICGNINKITQIINVDELILENYALREKLKEITMDRDRLLCEVSNLRLELDMQELKRLPELER